MAEDITFFAETDFRNEKKKFGIKLDDRRKHTYVIGKTGMGKSELLKNMAIQDIMSGKGIGFVDPHGESAEEILNFVPAERIKDVIYFNPADLNFPITFNVMEKVDVEHRHLVASGLMGVFKKIWPDVWSARMEYILNNAILALLEYPNSTLLGINRVLFDPDYRSQVVEQIQDPVVKAFWLQEFARYTQRYEVEATAAIQNKIGQFISSPLIRNIIGQTRSSIDMRKIMDEKKILILNLSKGRIGEDSSKLLGGLLITKLQLAAMSRVEIIEGERADFFLYVDEFQNFATESFANILSEARKYRLDLILAHQYITQMEDVVRDAVFGNVGTLITFRVGAEDAEYLEKEFSPQILADDLVNLPKYRIYLKLIIDGVAGRPFSAKTLPPFKRPDFSYIEQIIKNSREQYADSREEVEGQIARWTGNYILNQPAGRPPAQTTNVELHDAQCQQCGKWSKVPFKPDPNRPLLCKPCLKAKREQSGDQGKTIEVKKSSESERTIDSEKAKAVEPERTIDSEKAKAVEPEIDKEPEPEKDEEGVKSLSLEDLLMRKPVSFTKKREQGAGENHGPKKEVDRQALKKILKDSLPQFSSQPQEKEAAGGKRSIKSDENNGEGGQKGDAEIIKEGTIEPGGTVSFN